MDFHINIDNLQILQIRESSGIFSGENNHVQWLAMSKSNTGISLGEKTVSHGCINLVSDHDKIDLWSEPVFVNPPSERPVSTG